ncbi:uncharacterized protein LOC143021048 isoform X2 [Oratosquilla oratoria]|uniref:uncharacterized protein LOC143021048 isoform X2 n=1 Tax=Oratosquilla oratoria TaxID=337810 RepID=UPI003F772B3A
MGRQSLINVVYRSVIKRSTSFQRTNIFSELNVPTTRCFSSTVLKRKDDWVIQSPYSDVEIPDVSFSNYIFEAQEQFPDKTAMVDGLTGATWTHGEMLDMSIRLASGLHRLGLHQGDVLGIVSPNCPEFGLVFCATAALGAINTTVNCTYTAEEIAQQLHNSGASMVMTHPLLLPVIRKACHLYKGIRHIIVSGAEEEGTISLQRILNDDKSAFPHNVKINPAEDLVALPYSSGTTGLPKGVMLTHRNLVANIQQVLHDDLTSVQTASGDTQECFLGVLPMFHIYGMVPMMSLCMKVGGKMVTLPRFDPQLYKNSLLTHKPSVLHTVPPLLGYLVQDPTVKPEMLKCVHNVLSGAAPAGPSLINLFFKKFTDDICFQEGYGMTEASPVTHLSPKKGLVIGSCGNVLPNTKAKIIDLSTGNTLGPNEGEGELCVHGPQVMKGYYHNEKATKDTIDEDGWLHTGDIAKMDEDKNVFIVDRLKELIKVKGLQVAPAELEDILRRHPTVADVAVIGIPDERAGELPRAYVVASSNSSPCQDTLASYVADIVAPHKKLAGGVHFVDQIPKSPTGKILRRELKAAALQGI